MRAPPTTARIAAPIGARSITLEEAGPFLDGSELGRLVHHMTRSEHLQRILAEGLSVESFRRGVVRGTYTSTWPGTWGQEQLVLAVRAEKPLYVGEDEDVVAAARLISGATGRMNAAAVADALLGAGYDAVIWGRGGKDPYPSQVVALRDDRMRLVVDATGAPVRHIPMALP